jgi:hypothetical protein
VYHEVLDAATDTVLEGATDAGEDMVATNDTALEAVAKNDEALEESAENPLPLARADGVPIADAVSTPPLLPRGDKVPTVVPVGARVPPPVEAVAPKLLERGKDDELTSAEGAPLKLVAETARLGLGLKLVLLVESPACRRRLP